MPAHYIPLAALRLACRWAADRALEDAARAVIERIRAEAGASIVFGTPE